MYVEYESIHRERYTNDLKNQIYSILNIPHENKYKIHKRKIVINYKTSTGKLSNYTGCLIKPCYNNKF